MNRRAWLLVKIVILIVIFISLSNVFLRLFFNEYDWVGIGTGYEYLEDDRGGIAVRETEYSGINYIDSSLVNISLEIRESPVDQVKLIDTTEATGLFKKYHPIKVKQKGNTLMIEQKNMFFLWNLFINKTRGNVVLEIPHGQKLSYDLEALSGDIIVDAQSKGKLEIESVSGNIDIYQGGEYLNVESVSGNIKLQKPFIEIEGETVSGDMIFIANEMSQKISSDSVSGDTTINLQNIEGYDLEFSTVSGEVVDSERFNDRKSRNIRNSTSGLRINFDSVSGDLLLKTLEQ